MALAERERETSRIASNSRARTALHRVEVLLDKISQSQREQQS